REQPTPGDHDPASAHRRPRRHTEIGGGLQAAVPSGHLSPFIVWLSRERASASMACAVPPWLKASCLYWIARVYVRCTSTHLYASIDILGNVCAVGLSQTRSCCWSSSARPTAS